MLHTSITIDLPSEPYPTSGRIASLMRWVLLGPDPHAGRKRLTVSGLTVLDKLLTGLAASGFDDVISVLVDRRPVYIDTQQRLDDIQLALDRTLASGALRQGLRDVHMVLSRAHDGVHSLADVTLDDEVLVSEHPVALRWSTRIASLRVRPDEGPLEYRERVRDTLSTSGLRPQIAATTAASSQLADNLRAHLQPATVSRHSVVGRVVVPGPTQVGRFRHLGFRQRLRARVYRAEPKDKRIGAYDDPHVYYYYDPYHDLLSWLLVHEALAGRWDAEGVEFVHPDGRLLFVGGQAPREPLDVPSDAVEFHAQGLRIDDGLPVVGFDRAEAGSPHAPGWGGESC
ncbi:MAG: hypothetical protein AAGF11_14885 [Myxococcota bacterium]